MSARRFVLACVMCCLAGCGAKNALLREETAAFAESAAVATDRGVAFYDDVVDADRELRKMLLKLDAGCIPSEFAAGTPQCRIGDAATAVGGSLPRSTFAFERAQLSFLANYIGALADLAGDVESHAGANFESAIGDLEAIRALFGSSSALISDERIAATSSLLDFINELSKEHASAKAIRQKLESDGPRAREAFDVLAAKLKEDNRFLTGALDEQKKWSQFVVARQLIDAPEARAAALTSAYATADLLDEQDERTKRCTATASPAMKPYCGAPAAGLMAAAAIAHSDLISLAAGNYTAEHKARMAKIALKRFVAAAKLFVSLTGVY